MGWFSDRWDDFKSGAKTGFITVLPGGVTYLMWDELGNVEVVNAGTDDAMTGQDVLIDASVDKAKDALGVPDLEPDTLAAKFGDVLAGALLGIGSGLSTATLQFVRGVGPAVVDGVDNTFDYIRDKLRGKEPDIIAAVTVGVLSVLAGVYLWNTAKRGAAANPE